MKFAQLIKGTRAERVVEVPGLKKPDGSPITVAVRPLTGAEETAVMAGAHDHAVKGGVQNPRQGDELYDLGRMAHTLALACVDVDSPQDARTPFFGGGATDVLEMHVEAITYLWEHCELFQEESSPYRKNLSDRELLALASEVAAPGGEATFIRLSPSTRLRLLRSMAGQLSSSRSDKSACTAPSSASGDASSDPTVDPPDAATPRSTSTTTDT